MTELMWFRRDLRLTDNPALGRAAAGGEVVGLFVLDPALLRSAGPNRLAWLSASLKALDDSMGGALHVVPGRPSEVVPRLAAAVAAERVHVSADFGPYGRRRDASVSAALSQTQASLIATGSPYAIAPGRVAKGDGSAYRVFTPFYKAWLGHGWRPPLAPAPSIQWRRPSDVPGSAGVETVPEPPAAALPCDVGERAAERAWEAFRQDGLAHYRARRDRPDLGGTSVLSPHLRWGEIHPRTLLADLDDGEGAEAFRRELAFREFYADILARHPSSATNSLDPNFDKPDLYRQAVSADADFEHWCRGTTGYPFVDAGMRQLLAQGWMHNRVRMVVASFLVKDLLIPWWRGAEWFMRHLADGDLASNSQGWQWVAGCGTDAAPYFRVFNPVTQGLRFDPHGDYVRRFVPELRGIEGAAVHEPWTLPSAVPGYPEPIVDHGEARKEALARFAHLREAATALTQAD